MRLEEALRDARQRWPGVEADLEGFVRSLASRISDGEEPVRVLERLHVDSLWLAYACSAGCAPAVEALQGNVSRRMTNALRRLGPQQLTDDVTQQLYERLLVGGPERPPEILKYGGRGDLGKWLEVLAVRDAYKVLKKQKKEAPASDKLLLQRVASDGDFELDQLKAAYRTRFKHAFQSAFAGLSARQRNILRYQYLDGLNIDQIGAIFHVHRATVARWRAGARDELFDETRRILVDDLQVSGGEFESIMRLIRSQLEVSLPRLLEDDD